MLSFQTSTLAAKIKIYIYNLSFEHFLRNLYRAVAPHDEQPVLETVSDYHQSASVGLIIIKTILLLFLLKFLNFYFFNNTTIFSLYCDFNIYYYIFIHVTLFTPFFYFLNVSCKLTTLSPQK